MKRCFESLREITVCAICLETVRPDMVQCVNGHIFCSQCKRDLDKCPTCRDNFSEIKPCGMISQVIEAFPSLCKHHCGKYVKPDDNHEKVCGLQVTLCHLKDCNWEGSGQSILQHILENHPDEEILSESQDVVISNVKIDEYFSVYKFLYAKGYFFWYEIVNDINNKLMVHKFHFVPNGKRDHGLNIKIKSVGNIMKFMFKISLYLDPDATAEHTNYFNVPSFIVSNLIKEQNLNFKLSVKTI